MARERNDQQTTVHRPWRSSSFMMANRSTASLPSSATTTGRTRGRNPAVVDLPSGRADLGVHAWHVLLDTVGAMDPPEDIIYGNECEGECRRDPSLH